jgi:late competence protein required for DNA uptake (superfamily II DNA/RNA helicase)
VSAEAQGSGALGCAIRQCSRMLNALGTEYYYYCFLCTPESRRTSGVQLYCLMCYMFLRVTNGASIYFYNKWLPSFVVSSALLV